MKDKSKKDKYNLLAPYELTRDEMLLKNTQGELDNFKNVVGPLFMFGGIYGFFAGMIQSARTIPFRNRPPKLVFTSLLNIVGKECTKYANAGAGLGLVYCFSRKAINFLFDEEIKDMKNRHKQLIYGFTTGALFKCTRGLAPAILSGILVSQFCYGFSIFYSKYYKDS